MSHHQSNGEKPSLSGLVDKVRRTLGRVPFAEQALAAYCCAIDASTPKYVKVILMGALAYFLMPADAIPDFIAGLGYTDDAAIFWAAWNRVSAHVTEHHINEARNLLVRITGEEEQDD